MAAELVVEHQVRLRFGAVGSTAPELKDLSAVHWDGRWLWLAGDEQPRLERLTLDSADAESYGEHRSFALGEFVDLPEGPDKEVDVEGLDLQGQYLWVVGSHSRSRKRVDDDDDDDSKAFADLAKVRDHANRKVLIRLPLAEEGGEVVPALSTTTSTGDVLTAAVLSAELTSALGSDEHFSPFLGIPSKDNGLDIEGLVAFGDRVLLGLRGPVLRGWAAVLEVHPQQDPVDPARLMLGSPPYGKRFLDLGGLGVRDLCRDGDDVLVLAGPTMDLDGPVRVFRWHDAAHAQEDEVVRGTEISLVGDLPYGVGADHAEGITLVSADSRPTRGLVVYDSPARTRLPGEGVLRADIVAIPT